MNVHIGLCKNKKTFTWIGKGLKDNKRPLPNGKGLANNFRCQQSREIETSEMTTLL